MGWPEVVGNGRKSQEQSGDHSGRRRRSFAGPIRERPAAVGRETSRSALSGCPFPPCLARVAGGRPVVPLLVQTPTARKWSK